MKGDVVKHEPITVEVLKLMGESLEVKPGQSYFLTARAIMNIYENCEHEKTHNGRCRYCYVKVVL